jgi:enterochelin esterase-like enzyme
MNTRQAIAVILCLLLLGGLSACSPSQEADAQAIPSPTSLPTATATAPPTSIPATPTPLTCLTEPGLVKQDVVSTTRPPQEFIVYLPPCYETFTDIRYPVLYLLHGQTYTMDQWVRMGAPAIADRMIHANESQPFIMVFPDDRYWNSPAGAGFGDRFINDLIPYVDQSYRTLTDREHRALGGLSRGGGWTVQLGLAHPELFGALGLHSPAVFKDNAPYVANYILAIPLDARPKLWLDVGESDSELASAIQLEEVLVSSDYPHKFHRFTGDHSEVYWSAHVEDYLRWYAGNWDEAKVEQ